ncbi:helix-turn-helix domain-containing protein [Gordonia iterans]
MGALIGDETVKSWQARLSRIAGDVVEEPPIHGAGARALRPRGPQAGAGGNYELYRYCRRQSTLTSVFAMLGSPAPVSTEWADLWTGDEVVFGTYLSHGAGGSADLTVPYRPGDLILTGSATRLPRIDDTPCDAVGVLIPWRLVSRWRAAIVESPRPIVLGSLLARSAAAYLTSFAVPVATGLAPESGDAELALVEVLNAVLEEMDREHSAEPDNPLLVRAAVLDLIERKYSYPDFGVDAIASELYLSRRQVYRYFEGDGPSLASRIADRRARAALDMLRADPRVSVGTVARRAGFGSVATFRKRFREKMGIGPSEYRLQLLNGRNDAGVALSDLETGS